MRISKETDKKLELSINVVCEKHVRNKNLTGLNIKTRNHKYNNVRVSSVKVKALCRTAIGLRLEKEAFKLFVGRYIN